MGVLASVMSKIALILGSESDRDLGDKAEAILKDFGVDYDCDKDANGTADGLDYDRSPSTPPNPPWEVGPPNAGVGFDDVGAVLAQTGLDCSGPP